MADIAVAFAAFSELAFALRVEVGFAAAFALLWALSISVAGKRPRGKIAGSRACKVKPAAASAAQGREEGSVDLRSPTTAELCDVRWVLAAVQQLARTSTPKALQLYRDARRAGLELTQMPEAEGAQLFLALTISAIRGNHFGEVLPLLQDCRKGPGASATLLASSVKVCTSKQLFKECLEIHDFFSQDPAVAIEDPSVWSCLLFCATEAQAHRRCGLYFQRIRSCGVPSNKDFSNMVRCAATGSDWRLSLKLIREMQQLGLEIDSIDYNTALGTCVAAGKMDEARLLLNDMESVSGAADVVTYNMLSKGYARVGKLDDCFELLARMRAAGMQPSQVTYGILLDACINQGNMEKAAEVFNVMAAAGLVMNTVLYTTLIKGFIKAERLDEAMRVYKQMCEDRGKGVMPDLITFSILIKAHCDADRLEQALSLQQAMLELEICPDEVVFNNLLCGCIHRGDSRTAKRLYSDMVKTGVKPSNATFSILIRMYAESKLLHEAFDMLAEEPLARGVKPEARLFLQLAQACLRERQSRRAVDTYRLMLRHCEPGADVHSGLLSACTRLNTLDAAAEILAIAVEHGKQVDVRDAVQLRDICVRKRKSGSLKLIGPALASLGISAVVA